MAQKLTAINTISLICEKAGGDVREVARCVGADSRINDKFMSASIGFGGYCLEKDVKSLVYIAQSLGLYEVAEYWDRVVKFNRYQMERFGKKIIESFDNNLKNKKILLFGAAFKANTNDCRNSCIFEILKVLLQENVREITVVDPLVSAQSFQSEFFKIFETEFPQQLTYKTCCNGLTNILDDLKEINGIAFATDHDLFKDMGKELIKHINTTCLIFDGRRILDKEEWEAAGFHVFTIGSFHK